jgi:glycosyltransferase involved in cell wall biosynthesis
MTYGKWLSKIDMFTIAIPTYNRNEILLDNLRYLLPQLTPDHFLLILDNHSDIPVKDTLQNVLKEYSHLNIEIQRNSINIGGHANIFRCFEFCKTEWLWVLSDDDRATEHAVETISRNIQQYRDYIFINFSNEIHKRSQSFHTQGLSSFIKTLDHFGNTMFISTNLYHASLLKSGVPIASDYSYSYSPHFALLLVTLREDKKCCLSNEQIVHYIAPPLENRWSNLDGWLRITALAELLSSDRILQSILVEKIKETFFTKDRFFVLHLLADDTVSKHEKIFYYDKTIYNFNYFTSGYKKFFRIMKHKLYRQILIFPQFAEFILKLIFPKKYRDFKKNLPFRRQGMRKVYDF